MRMLALRVLALATAWSGLGIIARAETVRHELYGVSLRPPAHFTSDPDVARSRDGILWAWDGRIDEAYTLLIVEKIDAPPATSTTDDGLAAHIVDAGLISAHATSVERRTFVWRGREAGGLVGLVEGDAPLAAHYVVDLALRTGGSLRIRLSSDARKRPALERLLKQVISSVTERKPHK